MTGDIYYDEFDIHEETGERTDLDVEKATPDIWEIIEKEKVVTDRELKVRLEKKYFPWIVGRAIKAMENEGVIRKVGYMGRRSAAKRIPRQFFIPAEAKYEDVVGIIEKKNYNRH